MAELAVDCPTPEGHVEYPLGPTQQNEPPTNLRIREFLKKHHKTTDTMANNSGAVDSENSSDDQQRQHANLSPPPNCSICLGRVKSKCFTDSCMHQFCFSCLLEWSKVKPECPLCKQTFKSIIHNVTSMDSYEEYKVEAQQRHVSWINLTQFQPVDVDMNFFLQAATIPTQSHRIPSSTGFNARRYFAHLFQTAHPNDVFNGSRLTGSAWRSYVYHRNLYAEPLNDLGGQIREISAPFLRANPAQTHRLAGWLNREVVALCTNSSSPSVQHIVQRIEYFIQEYDMTSQEFRSNVRQFIPSQNVDHFIHELINFARSPYDMVGYDRFVTYTIRPESELNQMDTVSLSSVSEEGSDVEWIGPIDVESTGTTTEIIASTSTNGNTAPIAEQSTPGTSNFYIRTSNQSTDQTLIDILTNDSDEDEIADCLHQKPNVSVEDTIVGRTGPSSTDINPIPSTSNGTTNNRQGISFTTTVPANMLLEFKPSTSSSATGEPGTSNVPLTTPKIEPNTDTNEPTVQKTDIINADDSDSDECLFVCAKKPPHLRTPEYVELNSDSDSDVVFISSEPNTDAIKPNPIHPENMVNNRTAQNNTDVGIQCGTSTNIIISNGRRKRSRNMAAVNSHLDANNSHLDVLAKASESTNMIKFLIKDSTITSEQVRLAFKRSPITKPPKKIWRGKRMFESSTDSDNDDESNSKVSSSSLSTCSTDSSDDDSSSHEEYGNPKFKARSKKARIAKNVKPTKTKLKTQLKKLVRRRGKQMFETSSSSDDEDS